MSSQIILSLFGLDKYKLFKLSRLNKKSYLHVYRKFTDYYIKDFYNNELIKFKRKVVLKYLNKENIDAFAEIVKKNIDSIYISYGTIFQIHDLFYKLFSNPSVFSQYGNTRDNQFESLSDEILNFKPIIKNKTVMFNMPSDKVRQVLARDFSLLAVKFIIFHELGHHMNGHLLYQNDHGNFSPMERKTIEMDADAFAVTQSIQYAFHNKDLGMISFSELKFTNIQYIEMWIYVIHIIFLFISGEEEFIEKDRMKRNYLPRRVRSLLASQISFDLFKKFFPNENYDFNSLFVNVVRKAELDYNATFNKTSSELELFTCFSDGVITHMKEINEYWDKVMYHKLKPYARVPLFKRSQ